MVGTLLTVLRSLTLKALHGLPVLFLLVLGAILLASPRSASANVNISKFEANPDGDHITVKWTTATEVNNAGFNLLRGTDPNGEFTQIAHVGAKNVGGITGANYSYDDSDVSPGQQYYYRLESVDFNNSKQDFGPVNATANQAPDTPTPTDTPLPTDAPTSTEVPTAKPIRTPVPKTSTPIVQAPQPTNTSAIPTATAVVNPTGLPTDVVAIPTDEEIDSGSAPAEPTKFVVARRATARPVPTDSNNDSDAPPLATSTDEPSPAAVALEATGTDTPRPVAAKIKPTAINSAPTTSRIGASQTLLGLAVSGILFVAVAMIGLLGLGLLFLWFRSSRRSA